MQTSSIQKRIRVDIPSEAIAALDFLCGKSGETRPGCIARLIAMGIRETECYMQKKKYQDVIEKWGEPTRRMVMGQ